MLKWVAISFSRGSSCPRGWTQVSCIAGRLFTDWATRELFYWKKLIFNSKPSTSDRWVQSVLQTILSILSSTGCTGLSLGNHSSSLFRSYPSFHLSPSLHSVQSPWLWPTRILFFSEYSESLQSSLNESINLHCLIDSHVGNFYDYLTFCVFSCFLILDISPSCFAHTAAAAASLQSCPTLCDPRDGTHQAPPSLGFSKQEHSSGLPFPSPMHEIGKWKWSHSVMSDPQRPHGLQPTRLIKAPKIFSPKQLVSS